ncbi:glycerophosphodiester phosphodiesterase family protein [Hymenobacter sp. AT01-02]|uniref:glycerophosphodiester phosphodiesterase family protein n=1 Tax=Hymenobacter sp. AT01-02 TaxID=1571877 RepID=UPI00191C4043
MLCALCPYSDVHIRISIFRLYEYQFLSCRGSSRPSCCRGLHPENTLQAFRHALALGVDVLEMDVVLSADGQVVVSHEPGFRLLSA